MKYIEQLLNLNNAKKLWYYLPFTVFFLGIMFLNWIYIKFSSISTKELINQQIDLLGKNLNFLWTLAPFVILIIFLMVWVLMVHKQSLLSLFTSRTKVDWNRFLFAFGVQSAVVIIGVVISYINAPNDFVLNFDFKLFVPFVLIAILFVPIQTSFEELFIRGYLMQGVGLATKSRAVALIVTSVIFGLLHASNPEIEQLGWVMMIYYIGTGLFLGMIVLMDEGLELALGFHAANNLVGVLLVTSNWTAFQTNSLLIDISPIDKVGVTDFLIQVFVVLPLMFVVFYKKYKWTGIKQHLFGRVK
ncbi:MAG: CPBP family intramembrane metalloprotease [Flavobacteriaceae bacterium]|jgi:membrane protease YdiL (CAAX protease family)|nr:CPBP family intramembrane metalloprotease [Flavobacteriaceae bacterium]